MPRKARTAKASLAQRVAAIERRCRGCPHSRRPIGFQTDAIGIEIETEEGAPEEVEEFPEELKGEGI